MVTLQLFVSHLPFVVLQMLPLPHCVSLVHLPQKLAVVAPQIEPFALALQSALAVQSPGTQEPETHRLFAP